MLRLTKHKTSQRQRVMKPWHNFVKDHFIPHSGNNHLPHALRHRALFGYSLSLLSLKIFTLAVGIALPTSNILSSAITPNNIITLTNETRASLDLPELNLDPKLSQAAQAKAEDMFLNKYFAHTSPTGTTPWHWFELFGYNYRSAGENLAAHFNQAEDVRAGWMASPTHRDNIVSDRFNEIGVGVAQGIFEGYQTTFVVQLFGYELGEPVTTTAPIPTAPEIAVVVPEPTPESPVVATPEVQDGDLVIDTSSLILTPLENGYAAKIHMQNVNEAVLSLGEARVPFVPTAEADIWQSLIVYQPEALNPDGEKLSVVAGNADGELKIVDLAWIMPGSSAPEIYAFQSTKSPKLLGVMDVVNLDKHAQTIYLIALVFLGLSLALAVFVKIKHQHPTMIAHGLTVIALALILSII